MTQQVINQLHMNWQNSLLENSKALANLDAMKSINKPKLFKELELGLVTVPDKDSLPKDIYKQLSSFGLMDDNISGMISLPLRKKDNRISNFYFISLNGKDDTVIRKGGIINLKAFAVFKRLIIVDTLDDYFAYFQQVKENIVPMIQADVMPDDIARALKNSSVEELILINNSPYWEILVPKLEDCDVNILRIDMPENIPIKEFLNSNSPNKLTAYLEAEKARIIHEQKGSEQTEYMQVIEGTGEMTFTGQDRSYRIRGFNKEGFEKIVQMSLEIDGRVFPDKVDLSRSQSRGKFANIAGAEFEMSAESIRNDLAFIYKKLDEIQDSRFKEKAGNREKNVHIITPKEVHKAIDLLNSRDLLTEILIKDTERMGYVEEDINKKLFYLSATSRLTGKPVSVLDISPPGTGKSFGLATIMELMPPDELLMYSRITPNALYYKNEEELRGKVLYIEEIVGMEESLESIRMILSAGELAVSVVEKDPRTGTMHTAERRIKVDIPIVSSGVRDIFDDETLSRFVCTYNDVTQKHMERILKSQAYKYSLDGEKIFLQKDRFLKKHRDMQKVLDPEILVINPYAERIMVNPNLHIVTRKQEQYLRLMYNIAFLRQHSREKKIEKDRFGTAFTYVEVMPEDIESANEIAVHVFKYSQGDLTKTLDDAYRSIKRLLEEKVKTGRKTLFEIGVSKKELMDKYNWPETTARRYLQDLVNHEYLVRIKEARTRQYVYRLLFTDDKKEEGLKLLDPFSL